MKLFRNPLFLISFFSVIILSSGCEKSGIVEEKTVYSGTGLPMNGSQARPATPSPATGTIDAVYDRSSRLLTYTIKFNGLFRKPLFININGAAEKGYNAYNPFGASPTFVNVYQNNRVNQSGTIAVDSVNATYRNTLYIDGTIIKEGDLLGGRLYVTVHTPNANPALNAATLGFGEIRGQIELKRQD
jgi:CHRD domain